MKRIALLVTLLLMSFNTVVAQEDITGSAMQDLVNAVVGHGVKVLVSQLSQGVDIEFPETIKVLGALEFDSAVSGGGPMPAFPMLRTETPISAAPYRAIEVILESDKAFSELNLIFDAALEASGYAFISDNLLARQQPRQWGFVPYIEEEPQQIDRTYCNESYQLWVNGHQNQFPSHPTSQKSRLRMYIGQLSDVTACQQLVVALEEQNWLSPIGPHPTDAQGIVPVAPSSRLQQKSINDLPKLILVPPHGSDVISISNPSRFPEVYNNSQSAVPATWLNRTVITSSLSNETLHDHYSQQLRQQDWVLGQSGVNTPFVWSEWEVSAPDGTQWIGVLQFTTNFHLNDGASMITLQLFEKPF